jgi:hypothetical protein
VRFKVIVLGTAAVLILVALAGCAGNYSCKFSVRLEFGGDVHRPAMFLELYNLKFDPRISNNYTEAVDFSPRCDNETFIKKADEAKVLPKISHAYAYSREKPNRQYHEGNWSINVLVADGGDQGKAMEPFYKSWTMCVKDILQKRILKDLNMTMVYEGPVGKCSQLPGFSADLLIGVVLIAIVVVRRKMVTKMA